MENENITPVIEEPVIEKPIAPQVPQEPEKKNNLFKITVIIIGILIAVALFVNAYLLLNKKETVTKTSDSTPTATPIIKKTVDWETYIDAVYGFQIDVPPGWYMYPTGGSEGGKALPGDTFTASNYDLNDPSNFSEMNISDKVINPLSIEIGTGSNNNTKSLNEVKQEWIKNDGDPEGDSLVKNITKSEEIKISNVEAVKFSYKNELVETIFIVDKTNHLFQINYYDRDHLASNKKLFDQILSTFKFIE